MDANYLFGVEQSGEVKLDRVTRVSLTSFSRTCSEASGRPWVRAPWPDWSATLAEPRMRYSRFILRRPPKHPKCPERCQPAAGSFPDLFWRV